MNQTMSISASHTELTAPMEWDHDVEMEELSATSNEEASKVLEQWQTDDDEDENLKLMEVDAQIGSNLLGDDMFGEILCVSPTGPLEELALVAVDEEVDRLFLPLTEPPDKTTTTAPAFEEACISSLPFEERYQATLKKLQESMNRSQETRKSLTMKTCKTEKYTRIQSVSQVLSSILSSSRQLQDAYPTAPLKELLSSS
jgi:hypothetical protein